MAIDDEATRRAAEFATWLNAAPEALEVLAESGICPAATAAQTGGVSAEPPAFPSNQPDFYEQGATVAEGMRTAAWGSNVGRAAQGGAGAAALAERDAPLADPGDSFVVLLAGDRFGAGIIDHGRPVRGAAGGGGEMHYLNLVEGVGHPAALAPLAIDWTEEALARGTPPSLAPAAAKDPLRAADVFAAAADDALARGVVDRLTERLARVIATLASLLNPQTAIR